MREAYNNLIRKKGISDILFYLTDLSYSKKFEILTYLLDKYSVENVNLSLEEYYNRYILLKRAGSNRVFGTLKGMCERRK